MSRRTSCTVALVAGLIPLTLLALCLFLLWDVLIIPHAVETLAFAPGNPSTVYSGTKFGRVFRSTDGGEHWSSISTGLANAQVDALAIDPTMPTTLYAGTPGWGIFKSTNGGENWSTTGLTSIVVYDVVIVPVTPTNLYAIVPGGLLKSADGGETWHAIHIGPTHTHINA